MREDNDLIYTQEDIDVWVNICDYLQESLTDKRQQIVELKAENQQLKRQLHNLSKKILEEIKDKVVDLVSNYEEPSEGNPEIIILTDFQEILNLILKKY